MTKLKVKSNDKCMCTSIELNVNFHVDFVLIQSTCTLSMRMFCFLHLIKSNLNFAKDFVLTSTDFSISRQNFVFDSITNSSK